MRKLPRRSGILFCGTFLDFGGYLLFLPYIYFLNYIDEATSYVAEVRMFWAMLLNVTCVLRHRYR
jgi:hypothetical protein